MVGEKLQEFRWVSSSVQEIASNVQAMGNVRRQVMGNVRRVS